MKIPKTKFGDHLTSNDSSSLQDEMREDCYKSLRELPSYCLSAWEGQKMANRIRNYIDALEKKPTETQGKEKSSYYPPEENFRFTKKTNTHQCFDIVDFKVGDVFADASGHYKAVIMEVEPLTINNRYVLIGKNPFGEFLTSVSLMKEDVLLRLNKNYQFFIKNINIHELLESIWNGINSSK